MVNIVLGIVQKNNLKKVKKRLDLYVFLLVYLGI